MVRFFATSFRTRLLLLALLAIVPVLGVMIYNAVEQRRLAAAMVQANALHLARLAADNHEQLIGSTHELLTALAQLPQVRDHDSAACNSLFADLLRQYPHYTNLTAIEPDGDVFCSAVPFTAAVSAADRAWFRQAIQSRDLAIGDYQIGRITGKATVVLAHPVLAATGQVQALVTAALDLAWLNHLAAEAELPAGSSLTVIDQSGTILVRYPDPERWVGQSVAQTPLFQTILAHDGQGSAVLSGVDGVERLCGFTVLRPTAEAGRLYLSVGLPVESVFADVSRMLIRSLVGLGLVIALTLAVLWVSSDLFLVRPVKALVRAAGRLAGGDLTVRTGLAQKGGELGQLAAAFDRMAGALASRAAEQTAAEAALRTSEAALRQINDQLQTVLDALPAAVSWIGSDLKYLGANKYLIEMLGQPADAIIGQEVGFRGTSPEFAAFARDFFAQPAQQVLREISSEIGGVARQYLVVARKYQEDRAAVFVGMDVTGRRQMERKLREAEAKYRSLVEQIPAITYIAAPDAFSGTLYISPQIEAMLDFSQAQWTAEPDLWVRRLHPDDRERVLAEVAASHATGKPLRTEYRLLAGDGRVVWLRDEATVVLDDTGRPDFIQGVMVDITDRMLAEEEIRRLNRDLERRVIERTAQLAAANQELEQEIAERKRIEVALRISEERLRLLFEQANDAIFVANEDDEILDVNSRACDLLGYSRAELLRLKVPDLQAPEVRGEPGRVIRNELARGTRVFEAVGLHRDGRRIPIEVSTARVVGPEPGLVLAIVRDITERKRAETGIQKALEKERELSLLKSRFIAMVSHEFRTPLSLILSSAQLLEEYRAQFDEEKSNAYLRRIQAAVKQMADLLEDVLTVSKAEAGKLSFKPVSLDLVAFSRELTEELQLTAGARHKIIFTSEDEYANAYTDERLLHQVLTNLLSNAIKYSPLDSVIRFDLCCRAGVATFRIGDQGIGIPAEDQSRLFETFHRANNVGNISGSGLGLAIAKRAVDLLGGTIEVASQIGAGTIVTVTAPLRPLGPNKK
jgi:PAS domain S-box-containing protein